jgi:hypothetical protein
MTIRYGALWIQSPVRRVAIADHDVLVFFDQPVPQKQVAKITENARTTGGAESHCILPIPQNGSKRMCERGDICDRHEQASYTMFDGIDGTGRSGGNDRLPGRLRLQDDRWEPFAISG